MFYKKTYYPDNVELELCGYRSTTTGWIENIECPIEAYAAFLKNAGLPLHAPMLCGGLPRRGTLQNPPLPTGKNTVF